jgi:hypothetical protein
MDSRMCIILRDSNKKIFFTAVLNPQIQTITLENISQQQVL